MGRFVRGRRLDRNPLRRPADRVETLVLILLVMTFLVVAPLTAIAGGARAHSMAQRAQMTQAASRSQVTAVVLSVPAVSASAWGSWGLNGLMQARWTTPDGAVVAGELPLTVGTTAGETVRVWTIRSGQLASKPMTDSQVSDFELVGEAAGTAAVALVLAMAGLLAHRSLDKRRMAAWDDDWRTTGPRWTART
jgi:C4-dicarboxylate transporter